jgi:aldehyde:ferredoxin oxidoreductase
MELKSMVNGKNGYMGKVIRINLTTQKISDVNFDEKILRKYIGGRGLGVRILYDELPKDLTNFDPLGEKNIVVVMTGPYTGTPTPASARFDVATLSPHTGFLGAANAGGFFGPSLKRSGFDGLIITGKSENPVYISCIEGKGEIRDAKKIWGSDSYKTEDLMKEDLDEKRIKCLVTGPAGEKGVTFSTLICDRGRAIGRAGVGAVFGSKNLKGIAVYGTRKIEVAFPEKVKEMTQYFTKKFKNDPLCQAWQLNGTNMGLIFQMLMGDLPVRNYQKATFENIKNLSSRHQWETILIGHHACQGCVISCKRKIEIKSGKYQLEENPASGPEYEAIASLGANLLIDDIYAVAKANDYCNRMGMDTISTGSVISYAMECYEKGLITKEDLGGIDLKWGDPDAMLALLKLIGERENFILSRGVKRASKEIEGSENFAVHVKGLEVPMHDPRSNFLLALHYATTPYGAHHTSAAEALVLGMASLPNKDFDFVAKPDVRALDRLSPVGKAKTIITMQDRSFMFDSMGACAFISMTIFVPSRFTSAILALVTGWKMNYREKFLKTGERIANLCQAFNLRCGWKPSDNVLPYRLLKETHPDGGSKGVRINLAPMLREYYQLRDWNPKTGKPSQAKLEELELDDIAKELYS